MANKKRQAATPRDLSHCDLAGRLESVRGRATIHRQISGQQGAKHSSEMINDPTDE